jgi:PmbA protein
VENGTSGARSLHDLAEQVLALAKGRVEQAEVYAYETSSTPVDFEANRLKSLETKDSRGLSLRVVKDGRIGLAATTRLNAPDALALLADQAAELAAFGARAAFELPATVAAQPVDVFDPAAEALAVERMVALGEETIARIRAYDPEILCEAGVRRATETTVLLNSRGASGSYRRSSVAVIAGGQLIRGEDFLSVYEFETACGPVIDHTQLADEAIRKFELGKTISAVQTRRLPVVLTPRGVRRILWGPLAAALSGKSVLQGSSALSDKLGQRVFDERLTLVEDSTLSGVPGSAPFDDEGVPTRRHALIDRGTVAGFYYDLQTAGQAGTQSTGSGYRSPESLPSPSTGTGLMAPGDTPLADLIGGIEEGLLVESVTGNAGNVFSGDFSGNVQDGWKIEKGQVVGRVKDTMIAGNVFQDMRALGGLSRETEWVGGSAQLPHLLFAELGVSTKR